MADVDESEAHPFAASEPSVVEIEAPSPEPDRKPSSPTNASPSGGGELDRSKLNGYYNRPKKDGTIMTDDEVGKKMKLIVYVWSLTQLLGVFGMPLWLAVIATQWYTARNLLPGQVALVITFSKCIDVITDPMMAYYLRKCRMHKIAHIATLGSFLQAVFFIIMFIPFEPIDPSGGENRVLGQYAVSYVLFFVGDTLTGTPTTTLGTMLKSQQILNERHHNDGLRLGSMAKVAGILMMGFLTYIIGYIIKKADAEYDQDEGVQEGLSPVTNFVCSLIFGVIHFAINLWFSLIIRKFDDSKLSMEVENDTRGFLQGFSEMTTSSYNNPFFRQLIGAWICDQLTITLVKNLLLWFVRHNVEPELAKGCPAYKDPANRAYIEDGGFETKLDKSSFECSTDSVVKGGVFFVIVGAIIGNVFWQKKIERETDEYGNANLYQNWLLFNLSSAVTNGLMVFVGRGDSRLFWVLCLVNGLPFGGEFMTDTILLFLISSETWLNRSETPMNDDTFAEQFDSHTTKFSMMKTFIPKVVSLVAEAIPLALIQIWYFDPNDLCKDNGVYVGAAECEKRLLYEDGSPKYVPQKPQVRELIAFFFYILPTVTTLASYYLKSKFQVTDSANEAFVKSVKTGLVPKGKWFESHPKEEKSDQSAMIRTKKVKKLIDDFQRTKGSLDAISQANIELLIHQLARASNANTSLGTVQSFSSLQSLLALHKRTVKRDQWAGWIIPTINGQHLFRLPYFTEHMFAKIPVNVLHFACQTTSCPRLLPKAVTHSPSDTPTASVVKGTLHGLLGVVIIPLALVWRVLKELGEGMLFCGARCKAGRKLVRKEVRPLHHVMLFGVLGHRNIEDWVERILPLLAKRMLEKVKDWCSSPQDIEEFVFAALHDEKFSYSEPEEGCSSSDTLAVRALKRRNKTEISRRAAEREKALWNEGTPLLIKHVVEGDRLNVCHRIRNRLSYQRVLGICFSVCMVIIIAIIVAIWGGLQPIAKSKWSFVVTVPLFMTAVGVVGGLVTGGCPPQVVFLYFTGLLQRDWDKEHKMEGVDLFSLATIHYNSQNTASSQPLVFNDARGSRGKNNLLFSFEASPSAGVADGGSQSISYLVFLPRVHRLDILSHLEVGHRFLDVVAMECEATGGASMPKWSICNISPQGETTAYDCLLYTWAGVDPL